MKLKTFLVVLILASVFCMSSTALAMTEAERQALITQIQQQLALLLQQLDQAIVQEAANTSWCHTFNSNIGYAQSNTSEVAYLHIALLKQGISYSPDSIFTYTSNGTLQAVVQFQTKHGIYPQSGYIGPTTRAKLNQLYGCGKISGTCTSNWSCGSWGICSNNQYTRICTDSNHCGTNINKPATTALCTAPCTPIWSCGSWGACSNNQHIRICTDSNNCGVTTNKPATTALCTAPCTPNWSCGSWGTCTNGQQTRDCADSNGCGTDTGKPATTQSCITCTDCPNGCNAEGIGCLLSRNMTPISAPPEGGACGLVASAVIMNLFNADCNYFDDENDWRNPGAGFYYNLGLENCSPKDVGQWLCNESAKCADNCQCGSNRRFNTDLTCQEWFNTVGPATGWSLDAYCPQDPSAGTCISPHNGICGYQFRCPGDDGNCATSTWQPALQAFFRTHGFLTFNASTNPDTNTVFTQLMRYIRNGIPTIFHVTGHYMVISDYNDDTQKLKILDSRGGGTSFEASYDDFKGQITGDRIAWDGRFLAVWKNNGVLNLPTN